MPEHRPTTPADLALLESFLWHDLESEADWRGWCGRKWPARADGAPGGPGLGLHEALRVLAAANNDGAAGVAAEAARATLDRLIAESGLRPAPDRRGGFGWHAADRDAPATVLLVAVLEAMRSDRWRRFKLCRDPSCRAAYYDGSKPATKTWCAMASCGSRNKMRRFRAR